MVYVGSVIGFLLFPFIADNYGRKIAIQISWGLFVIACVCVAFAWNIYIVGIGFFLAGFGVNPATTIQLSLISE